MGKKLTTEEFIRRAKEVHGNKYDYSKSNYIGNKIKVIIICPTHGEFKQSPNSHLNKSGCPKCGFSSTTNHISSNSKKFYKKSKKHS